MPLEHGAFRHEVSVNIDEAFLWAPSGPPLHASLRDECGAKASGVRQTALLLAKCENRTERAVNVAVLRAKTYG